ncbi:MAG: alpha/beta fold hydrolase [Alkalispirochaeta sp.]
MVEVKSGYVEVAPGVELFYREAGSGTPLLFIPGWTFSSAVFERQLAGLSDRYRVIAIDPRSQGRSTKTSEGNTYGVHGVDIGRFLEKMDIPEAVLVGWSTGCLESFATVRAHGTDRIKGFVGIDMSPKALSSTDGDWVEGSIEEIAEVATNMLGTVEGQKGFVEFYATEVMVQRELKPEELDWITGDSLQTPTWVAQALWGSAMLADYLKEAGELDAARPTLYILAEHWAETARRFLKTHMPRTDTKVLGGHMMFWEHAEAFNAIVAEFVDSL